MEFKKKVQFLNYAVNDSGLHTYDFLDLESNLPFTVYSLAVINSYSKLEQYHLYDLAFQLVLKKTNTGIGWKVKGV